MQSKGKILAKLAETDKSCSETVQAPSLTNPAAKSAENNQEKSRAYSTIQKRKTGILLPLKKRKLYVPRLASPSQTACSSTSILEEKPHFDDKLPEIASISCEKPTNTQFEPLLPETGSQKCEYPEIASIFSTKLTKTQFKPLLPETGTQKCIYPEITAVFSRKLTNTQFRPILPGVLAEQTKPSVLPRIASVFSKKHKSTQFGPAANRRKQISPKYRAKIHRKCVFPELPTETEDILVKQARVANFYAKTTETLAKLETQVVDLTEQLEKAREVRRLLQEADSKFREIAGFLVEAQLKFSTNLDPIDFSVIEID